MPRRINKNNLWYRKVYRAYHCENCCKLLPKAIFLIIPFFLFFLLAGCVTIYNPATQKKETLLIDTRSEVSLGRNMDMQVQSQFQVLSDPWKQNRLDNIGQKIAAASDRQDLIYHFKIIKDAELNAFTIPGGYIYVNSGLMERASDDELACVIAHEIGHTAARHTVKKIQAILGYQIVMNIVMSANNNKSTIQAMDIVFSLASLGYGRQDETLADKLAVKYARKAGFNPYGMVTFFEKLKKEAEEKGANFNLVFLSSHPPIDERIKNVKNEIAKYP